MFSQTNISGVINDYARVVEFDDCGGSAVVEDDMDLVQGDRVLVIGMTGAFYYDGSDKNFGTVQEYSSCGLFEFATVESVTAVSPYYRVTFEHPTLSSYQAAPGALQLVKVPQYVDVTVTNDLTAQTWDGETGGVLVFEATGTLVLNDDITVNGKGFAGGNFSAEGSDEGLYGYAFPNGTGESGLRGGGIGIAPTDNAGRGTLVNGGGGGNAANAGGGGGGNAGDGGRGGNQTFSLGKKYNGGVGGRSIDYTTGPFRRIFMGGGGGGGQRDADDVPNTGTFAGSGARGGGIVIIRAAQIDGNVHTISANGEVGGWGNQDGGGGGGAGGAILLSVPSFIDDAIGTPDLTLTANGGLGGEVWGCHGPGGGGGGGFVGLSISASAATPVTTVNVLGGNHGSLSFCSASGMPDYNGALNGSGGSTRYSLGLPGDPLP